MRTPCRIPFIRHFAAQEMHPFSYGDDRKILLSSTQEEVFRDAKRLSRTFLTQLED